MDQFEFDHPCDVDGVRYQTGDRVNIDVLPADWVDGASKAKFGRRVKAVEVPSPKPPVAGSIPPEVDAAVKAALGS